MRRSVTEPRTRTRAATPSDPRAFLARLGLSPSGVARMLPAARRVLEASPGTAADELLYVPGRVELVGKHTDYGGGASLVMAVESGLMASATPGPSGHLRLEHLDAAQTVVYSAAGASGSGPWVPQGETPFWALYPGVLLNRLSRDVPGFRPAGTLRVSSTLPEAAGLSSSTAFLITLLLGFLRLGALPPQTPLGRIVRDRRSLAVYLSAVEAGAPYPGWGDGGAPIPGGVGTEGGTQDQAAILLAEPGKLLHLDYRPLRLVEEGKLPAGWLVAVGTSGVTARKAAEARASFNHLVGMLEDAWKGWGPPQSGLPHLGAIVRRHPEMAASLDAVAWASPALRERVQQFAAETLVRVPQTLRSLRDGDVVQAAHWVSASHRHAVRALGHQVPETESLVSLACSLGAPCASAFGAGFGGSVWALVHADEAEAFLKRWECAYRERHPVPAKNASFFLTPAGPGAAPGPWPGLGQ